MKQYVLLAYGLQAQHMHHRPDLQRQNSGLESMQSIEQALGNVEQNIMDRVAEDWMSTQMQPTPQHVARDS